MTEARFTPGDRIVNRITGDMGRVTGAPDAWGLVPVIYDDADGTYFVSPRRLQHEYPWPFDEGLTECRSDPFLDRNAA